MLFEDGVYDFDNDTFNSDPDLKSMYFMYYIPRKFPTVHDTQIIQEIKYKIFIEPFANYESTNDDIKPGLYLLEEITVALYGYVSKRFVCGVGNSNSGKSLLTSLLKLSFESFQIENMLQISF